MSKVLTGKVVSTKMQDTVLVEVVRRTPHKLYGKLLKRSKKYKVDSKGHDIEVETMVKIEEIKPQSRDKHFKIKEIIKKGKSI